MTETRKHDTGRCEKCGGFIGGPYPSTRCDCPAHTLPTRNPNVAEPLRSIINAVSAPESRGAGVVAEHCWTCRRKRVHVTDTVYPMVPYTYLAPPKASNKCRAAGHDVRPVAGEEVKS